MGDQAMGMLKVFPAYAGMFLGFFDEIIISGFPAYAGMFRRLGRYAQHRCCFPRIPGDVPWRLSLVI